MIKFSILGSPFQKIWHVYEPTTTRKHNKSATLVQTYPFTAQRFDKEVLRTWLGQRYQIRDVLHEDSALELEFGLAALVDELLVREFVLGFAEVDVFAAEEDGFEEVDVVLANTSS